MWLLIHAGIKNRAPDATSYLFWQITLGYKSEHKLFLSHFLIFQSYFEKANENKALCVRFEFTHWGRDKMAAIFQRTFSNAFSSTKMHEFQLRFHWSLFMKVQLTIFQHWFREWLGATQVTSHCLNQWWLLYWCIYASLGLNELTMLHRIFHTGNKKTYGFLLLILCSSFMSQIFSSKTSCSCKGFVFNSLRLTDAYMH